MERTLWIAGSLMGLLGVVAGTFAAHVLKQRLSTEMVEVFEVGVRYQMYHALATLACAWRCGRGTSAGAYGITSGGASGGVSGETSGGRWAGRGGVSFVCGVVVFSGSLYLMAITGQRWLGMITPIGGLAFLMGWILLLVDVLKTQPKLK